MSRIESLDCDSFEDRIHQILDDRLTLTGDDLLMAHAACCADCEKILNDYDSVDDSIKLLPDEIAQILTSADANRAATPIASRRLVILAALAAMIVVSLNVLHQLDKQPANELSSVATNTPLLGHSTAIPFKSKQMIGFQTAPAETHRATPSTSPFSPEFSFVSSMPNINLPTVPTWNDISKSLDPLEPVFTYSTKIPAVRPVHCSLNAGINLLKRSFSKSELKPDLGFWIDADMLAAV